MVMHINEVYEEVLHEELLGLLRESKRLLTTLSISGGEVYTRETAWVIDYERTAITRFRNKVKKVERCKDILKRLENGENQSEIYE